MIENILPDFSLYHYDTILSFWGDIVSSETIVLIKECFESGDWGGGGRNQQTKKKNTLHEKLVSLKCAFYDIAVGCENAIKMNGHYINIPSYKCWCCFE